MNKPALSTNIDALTGLRGVAAMYVVLLHYYYFAQIKMSNVLGEFIMHGYMVVDLFFVLSGFVMALNYGHLFEGGFALTHYFKFMGRRFARIYPTYLLGTFVAFVALANFDLDQNIHLSSTHPVNMVSRLIFNLSLMQGWCGRGSIDVPAWSISTEWAAYLLFPVLIIPCLIKEAKAAWIAGGLFMLLLLLLTVFGHYVLHHSAWCSLDLSRGNYDRPLLKCLVEFSLGLLSFRMSLTDLGKRLQRSNSFAVISIFLL